LVKTEGAKERRGKGEDVEGGRTKENVERPTLKPGARSEELLRAAVESVSC
jgi:hypothetical protein